MSAGIGNWQTFSEMAFKFRVTPQAIAWGLLFAAVIGVLGGLLPAWSAARKSIVAAMREAWRGGRREIVNDELEKLRIDKEHKARTRPGGRGLGSSSWSC